MLKQFIHNIRPGGLIDLNPLLYLPQVPHHNPAITPRRPQLLSKYL